MLSPSIKVNIVFKEEKKEYVEGKGTILIDDLEKNICDWEEFGGTGIQFESAEQVLKMIKEFEGCEEA